VTVLCLKPEEWESMKREAHLISFNETGSGAAHAIDFALLAVDEKKPLAYMTCRESDPDTVYVSHGGAMPETIGTANSYRAYQAMLDRLGVAYKRASTLIENTNTPMLRMAMKAGWLISGVRLFEGQVFVEHQLNFTGGL
jgi:hypothetical protein